MSEKLATKLTCAVPGCKSVILRAGYAEKDSSFSLDPPADFPALPGASNKDELNSSQFESLWRVSDKMDFDNIAFSLVLPGSGHRMLACADCEAGPVGFQPAGMEVCFIIPDRVKAE